jgi:flagellar M-ring protein FliF
MPEALKKVLQPFMALTPGRRWVVGSVAALSIIFFTMLIFVADRADYRPLFTNLASDDAGEIVKKLKEQKIPYEIGADGKSIMVPSDKVYELRLSLASDGLPQGGGVGFEIFDRKNFGMTEFVQKLNYQRALQGELSRTISQLSGVEEARVHIVIPEKSIFKDSEKPPTASVVLKMKGNRMLRDSEVQGVAHLVASAVEGMDPGQVTILDQRGKIMSKNSDDDATGKMTSAMLTLENGYERNTEDRLQSLLDKIVGPGRSVARVNASFDFRQVERYEEKYDPDSTAVRSEQKSEEKNGVSSTASGVPGAQSNLGKTTASNGGSSTTGSKSDETTNYEVSHSTARTIEPVGSLEKVSVAILVDGKYEASGKGASEKMKYIPRSPEELQKIEALVKSSVGFNAARGDQVTVANIPFQDLPQHGKDTGGSWLDSPILLSLIKNGFIGLGFLALLFFVIRPLLKILKSGQPSRGEAFLPLEEGDENRLPGAQRTQLTIQSVNQLELAEQVKKDPYQTAQILQNWLRQKE